MTFVDLYITLYYIYRIFPCNFRVLSPFHMHELNNNPINAMQALHELGNLLWCLGLGKSLGSEPTENEPFNIPLFWIKNDPRKKWEKLGTWKRGGKHDLYHLGSTFLSFGGWDLPLHPDLLWVMLGHLTILPIPTIPETSQLAYWGLPIIGIRITSNYQPVYGGYGYCSWLKWGFHYLFGTTQTILEGYNTATWDIFCVEHKLHVQPST